MKKLVISSIVIILVAIWCVRFYSVNGTFKVRQKYERIIYSMNEQVDLTESKSYNGIEQPAYKISVKNARIVERDDYLKEMNKTADDFMGLSERYLELTICVENNGDTENLLDLYGLPVLGTNWYTFYDPDATKYINNFTGEERAKFIKAKFDGCSTVKIAYRMYWEDFNKRQWNNLDDETMWLSVTLSPVEKRIKIEI